MSIWNSIVLKLRELIQSMIGSRTIQKELHVSYAISPKMEKAIQDWSIMYADKAPWLHEPDDNDPTNIVSLGLPALIASEKARTALLELESEITAPTEQVEVENPDYPGEQKFIKSYDGKTVPVPSVLPPKTIKADKAVGSTERAEYLESQYKKLKKQLRKQIEYGIAKGGLVIKPYVITNQKTTVDGIDSDIEPSMDIEFEFVQADAFYPLSFDSAGRITEAAFVQSKVEKNVVYRKLEYHKWSKNVVTVINKAYKSNNIQSTNELDTDLGEEISLKEVPEWKDLDEKATIKNVTQPLFAYFKMPEANTIDTNSPLGVSGFSRAVKLIRDADLQYSRLLWEYEGGELAIDIDRDALRTDIDESGFEHTRSNRLQQRLFRKVDLGSSSDTYQPFAPTLRDNHYIDGLNTILMRIEDVCGISRGTLSDSADVARTATELRILKQRSYQTNADIQGAIEDALRDTIYVMNVYASLYEITPEGEYDVSFEWDDSILVDVDAELMNRITLQNNQLTSRVETRMWYFGETERQAREALEQIDAEQQANLEKELALQANQQFNDFNDSEE